MKDMKFMIGQRVIYENVICTVCAPENGQMSSDFIWVYNPKRKYNHAVNKDNLKFLPKGQL